MKTNRSGPISRGAVVALVLAVFLLAPAADAKTLTVVSSQGKTLKIELLGVSGNQVKFKRVSDQRLFTMDIATFELGSQEAIRAAVKAGEVKRSYPKLRIDATIGRKLDRDKRSGYMRHEHVTAKFTVRNEELKVDLDEVDLHFVFYGRNPFKKENYQVLATQTLNTSIAGGKTVKLECKGFKTSFDEDRDASNVGGFRYEGYVVVVKDKKSGDTIAANASTGHVDKRLKADASSIEAILKLKKGENVTRELGKR